MGGGWLKAPGLQCSRTRREKEWRGGGLGRRREWKKACGRDMSWGRSLLLGLAQETGLRGPAYWLRARAACLLLAGEQ